jgi:hypothetical protein
VQAALLIAATESPDGGRIALVDAGHVLDALAIGDGQDDASALNGGERKGAAVGELAQGREVGTQQREGVRFATAHGNKLRCSARITPMITPSSIPCRTYAARH